MDWLTAALSSSGLGSIIGLAGGLITKFLEIKHAKQEMVFRLKERELDLKEAEQERAHELGMADKIVERAQVEGELRVGELAGIGFNESQKTNKVDGALRWVRPAITFYLLLGSSVLFATVWRKVGGLQGIPNADLVEMLVMMISSAMFLTVTCVAWWFGSRGGNLISTWMGKFK